MDLQQPRQSLPLPPSSQHNQHSSHHLPPGLQRGPSFPGKDTSGNNHSSRGSGGGGMQPQGQGQGHGHPGVMHSRSMSAGGAAPAGGGCGNNQPSHQHCHQGRSSQSAGGAAHPPLRTSYSGDYNFMQHHQAQLGMVGAGGQYGGSNGSCGGGSGGGYGSNNSGGMPQQQMHSGNSRCVPPPLQIPPHGLSGGGPYSGGSGQMSAGSTPRFPGQLPQPSPQCLNAYIQQQQQEAALLQQQCAAMMLNAAADPLGAGPALYGLQSAGSGSVTQQQQLQLQQLISQLYLG
jgi:hypothetical protein